MNWFADSHNDRKLPLFSKTINNFSKYYYNLAINSHKSSISSSSSEKKRKEHETDDDNMKQIQKKKKPRHAVKTH